MLRGWRKVGLRPSPEPALPVELDGRPETRDAKPVTRANRVSVLEVVPAHDVAGRHPVELCDRAHGVAHANDVDAYGGRAVARCGGDDDLRAGRGRERDHHGVSRPARYAD